MEKSNKLCNKCIFKISERRMITKITDLIDKAVRMVPNKVAFEEPKATITYSDLRMKSCAVATYIIDEKIYGNIAVFVDKSINCLLASFGVLYSGCTYCIVDTKSPDNRLNSILQTLKPNCIITEKKYNERFKGIKCQVVYIDDLLQCTIKKETIDVRLNGVVDTDPAYVLFTSGSTGVPKGTVVSHRAVIAYALSVEDVFKFGQNVRFGSQTPFYFSMSVLDIYVTLLNMGTLVIIPKMLFSFPVRLIEYMQDKKINTIYWVPTAFGFVTSRNAFSVGIPSELRSIMFAGEVMPVRYLNYWKQYLPGRMYANLFGPTEVTDTCTYYIVDRDFSVEETLPIGIAFPNCKVLLLDKDDRVVSDDETEGELCVGGSFLANGYWGDKEKTGKVFCQNPANDQYPEIIYRTGDIAYYDKAGIMMYKGRKDNQIKHLGYRIELGEIENVVGNVEGISTCACLYDKVKDRIILYYAGTIIESELEKILRGKLVTYMIPDERIKLKNMPINANGKIDHTALRNYRKDM